jgi:hypothetical protein
VLFKNVELSTIPQYTSLKLEEKESTTEAKKRFPFKALACGLIVLAFVVGMLAFTSLLFAPSDNPEATYHNLYGSTPLEGGNYSFSPPISMYRAVDIALASDGWNQSSLQNMTVHASLEKMVFYTNGSALLEYADKENVTLTGYPSASNPSIGTMSGFETLGEVTVPVDNYQPQFYDQVTVRYIWSITVMQNGGSSIPPPGISFVDASSGELVPVGLLI